MWDLINGNSHYEESSSFFTLYDLLDFCSKHPYRPIRFVGVSLYPGEVMSWRGSYDQPSISPVKDVQTGQDVVDSINKALDEVHYGYKGGEYKFSGHEEFYVAHYGSSAEYKVKKAELEGNEIVLYTKLDPW